jgi:hypothetical protein
VAKLKLDDEEVAKFEVKYKSFPEWSRALEGRAAGLRGEGLSDEAVAEETERERAAFYASRSRAFARATAGKGKPLSKMTHGDGKRVEEK